jgi:hypothetical protein
MAEPIRMVVAGAWYQLHHVEPGDDPEPTEMWVRESPGLVRTLYRGQTSGLWCRCLEPKHLTPEQAYRDELRHMLVESQNELIQHSLWMAKELTRGLEIRGKIQQYLDAIGGLDG